MQPSGEVGRFEVDDQPSPPADRKRYSIETHAPQCNNVNHWQFSTSTLLMLTLGTAVALAVSRLDTVFFFVVAFPIVFGPLGSFRVVVSVPSFVIGLLSSVFWTLISIVPFVTIGWIIYWPLLALSKGPLMQDFLYFLGVAYFLAASYLGGYIGGTVARAD